MIIFSIVLFFTLHKTAKIRGRVTSNRDSPLACRCRFFFSSFLILSQTKKRHEATRWMAQINEWKISFRLGLMERIFFYIIQLPFALNRKLDSFVKCLFSTHSSLVFSSHFPTAQLTWPIGIDDERENEKNSRVLLKNPTQGLVCLLWPKLFFFQTFLVLFFFQLTMELKLHRARERKNIN